MTGGAKPRLLFLRFTRPGFPPFFTRLLDEHVRCLSQFFDVIAINDLCCDYKQLCDTHEPDIAMFESGIAVAPSTVRNVSSHPEIPKIGFINCDAYCPSRKTAIRDMARWEISTFFAMAVSLGSYTPAIADQLFVWPNSVDLELYRDYGFPKVIPVLFSGSQAPEYPWRNRINTIVAQHFPSLHSPHFGWFWKNSAHSASSFLEGEKYAHLINSARVAPTCGTIANEVVRKHFEIPACNTCLLTQRTAALEAAGFVDLENCVFADDSDVLDKLIWLFRKPEELERITRAGKVLVDSRHTFRQRDQIYQWYALHKQLKPGQKIVQPGPFLPLRIVEENSGAGNYHVASQGIDRLLMNQGDAALRSGRYSDAERLYRRCLNYRGQNFAEPKFRLIRCWLNQGNSKPALATLREHFRSDHVGSENDREPDPSEWALFILVLLCCGKKREAALRAGQFAAVHSEELQRVRRLVRMLRGQSPLPTNTLNPAIRATVHDMPKLAIDEWLKSVGRMLEACGQIKTAHALAIVSSKLQSLEINGISKCDLHNGGPAATHSRKFPARIKQRLASIARPAAFENVTLKYYLAARRRTSRAARRITSQWKRLKGRIRVPWRQSSGIAEADLAMLVRLLQKEEMETGVLIGAAFGSWLSEAFMRGIQENPNMPSAICANQNTPRFRMFHRRFNDAANVEFRYLPNEGGFEPLEAADVIAIHCSDTLKNVRLKPGRASLILLDRIDSAVGNELFRAMMRDAKYVLVVYEPSRGSGYALFRRDAVNATRLAQQTAA